MEQYRREWIVIKESILSRIDREQELIYIHHQICYQEDPEQLSQVLELIDLNKYKVIRNSGLVKKFLLSRDKKSFCFLMFKN
jgi:hypothetical protein